jgi:hypothetical protein
MRATYCLLAQAALTYACQHEIHNHEAFFGLNERLTKRQEPVNFPPALDPNEAILLGAIESTDLDEWSNYYAHQYVQRVTRLRAYPPGGLHLTGD